ncbi:uncharacterized protein LOC108101051 [Drosophila ficusphila]|uniref:uncharacterized protein LOC108101051 n=1 Tax=Drosophila ficusphila TaxID=30025 RepID=UPI0007E76FF8|nr:uncharacterized protein LOC108101051 [Drosophila ficusphila]
MKKMPTSTKKSLKNNEETKPATKSNQQPICKVRHGLSRKTTILELTEKMKKVQKYRQDEDEKTTWINANGQLIGIQKKHVTNLGMDVDNFFKSKAKKSHHLHQTEPSNINTAPTLMESNEVVDIQHKSNVNAKRNISLAEENKPLQSYPMAMTRIPSGYYKWKIIMDPHIVQHIENNVVETIKSFPRSPKDLSISKPVNPKSKKKISKTSFGRFKKRSKEEEEEDYDDLTLCEFDAITSENDADLYGCEKSFSSEPPETPSLMSSENQSDSNEKLINLGFEQLNQVVRQSLQDSGRNDHDLNVAVVEPLISRFNSLNPSYQSSISQPRRWATPFRQRINDFFVDEPIPQRAVRLPRTAFGLGVGNCIFPSQTYRSGPSPGLKTPTKNKNLCRVMAQRTKMLADQAQRLKELYENQQKEMEAFCASEKAKISVQHRAHWTEIVIGARVFLLFMTAFAGLFLVLYPIYFEEPRPLTLWEKILLFLRLYNPFY